LAIRYDLCVVQHEYGVKHRGGFEGGFEILDVFLGENVGVGRIVGVFEAFVSEPGDVEAGIIRLMRSSQLRSREKARVPFLPFHPAVDGSAAA